MWARGESRARCLTGAHCLAFWWSRSCRSAISGAGWRSPEKLGVHYLVAQLGCTLVVLIMGYVLNKAWTFAARQAVAPTLRDPQTDSSDR